MDTYTVYMHTNKINGKRYIGITSQKSVKIRWKRGSGYSKQKRFYNAIKHYGWDCFEHEILFEGLAKEEAEAKEEELIKEYRSNDLRYGYNIENGGVIHKLSKEQKEHLRVLGIGRKHSEETKAKISKSHMGMSTKWLTGRKASDETRAKMSSQRAKEKNPRAKAVCQYDLDGNLIAVYKYMNEAREALGLKSTAHISQCCTGDRNKAYGFIWKYAEKGGLVNGQ